MEQIADSEQVLKNRPLERVFQNGYARVLDFLILNQRFDYSYSDISRLANVSPRTLQRVLPILLKEKLVVVTRKSGKAHMYEINKNSKRAEALQFYFNETNNEDFLELQYRNPAEQKTDGRTERE